MESKRRVVRVFDCARITMERMNGHQKGAHGNLNGLIREARKTPAPDGAVGLIVPSLNNLG